MIVENALGRWKCPFSAYPAVHIEKKGIGMTIVIKNKRLTPSCLKRQAADASRNSRYLIANPVRCGYTTGSVSYLFIEICQDEVGKVKHLTCYSKF